MNIGEFSVNSPVISWLLVIILVAGGVWGFEYADQVGGCFMANPSATFRA